VTDLAETLELIDKSLGLLADLQRTQADDLQKSLAEPPSFAKMTEIRPELTLLRS
jgi:hypothetical protein